MGHALRRVRARHSLRVLFRGLAILAAGVLLGVAVSAYGLDAFRYSRGAVLSIRALLYVWITVLVARFVVGERKRCQEPNKGRGKGVRNQITAFYP